ncbi:acyl carrier protein [Streptomyces sp. GESEQ-35]|uniref:acyl carrier protein n=1 Tax=Streptomyces sp. GESEQ-35 TaxID=2812657 RepID=UPI001B335C64|nr:acyl carrier protein [Streptomyces sp. GESEQ-35]
MTDSYRMISDRLRDYFGIDEALISEDRTFKDLEVDSITLVELLVILEEDTGLQLSQDATALSTDLTLQQASHFLDQARKSPTAAAGTK